MAHRQDDLRTSRLSACEEKRQGEKLRLTIGDDGIGLPDDFTKKEGVGLKVMRYRAAVMGGRVTFDVGMQTGARVRCAFPCRYA